MKKSIYFLAEIESGRPARRSAGCPAGRPVGACEKTLRHLLTWEDFAETHTQAPKEDSHCLAGHLHVAVDADGRMHACRAGPDAGSADVRDLGFEGAFEALPRPGCQACASVGMTEQNYLQALNPHLDQYAASHELPRACASILLHTIRLCQVLAPAAS